MRVLPLSTEVTVTMTLFLLSAPEVSMVELPLCMEETSVVPSFAL